jgi:hypothetical protein
MVVWFYASSPPIRFHGVVLNEVQDNFNFSEFYILFVKKHRQRMERQQQKKQKICQQVSATEPRSVSVTPTVPPDGPEPVDGGEGCLSVTLKFVSLRMDL